MRGGEGARVADERTCCRRRPDSEPAGVAPLPLPRLRLLELALSELEGAHPGALRPPLQAQPPARPPARPPRHDLLPASPCSACRVQAFKG